MTGSLRRRIGIRPSLTLLCLSLTSATACSPSRDGGKTADANPEGASTTDAGATANAERTSQEPTITAATEDIQVQGEIADGELIVAAPVPVSLRLADAEPPADHLLTCLSLGNSAATSCTVPITVQSSGRGTFSTTCPGLGAASVACYLRGNGTAPRSILLEKSDGMLGGFANVGRGILDLTITADPLGTDAKAAGTALDNLDEVLASAGRDRTKLAKSLTGTWKVSCREDPRVGIPCEGIGSFEKYLVERDRGDSHVLEEWGTRMQYEACANLDSAKFYGLRFNGRDMRVDNDVAHYQSLLDTVYADLPTSVRQAIDNDIHGEPEHLRRLWDCIDSPSRPYCEPVAGGPYGSRSQLEQSILRETTHTLLRSALAGDIQCAGPPAEDFKYCDVDGIDQRTGKKTDTCGFLEYLLPQLGAELLRGGRIIGNVVPSTGFAACFDAVQTPSGDFCDMTKAVVEGLPMQVMSDGRLGLPPGGQAGYDAAEAWYEFAVNWCPATYDAAEGRGDYDFESLLPACRAELAAMSKTQQLALVGDLLAPTAVFPTLCPAAVAAATTTKKTYADLTISCRDEFIALTLSEQRQRLSMAYAIAPSPLCAAPDLIASLRDEIAVRPSCVPGFEYFSECDTATGTCAPALRCGWTSCTLDNDGRPKLSPGSLSYAAPLQLGVDGSFGMQYSNELTLAKTPESSVSCRVRFRVIANATLRSADTFDTTESYARTSLCDDGEPYPDPTANAIQPGIGRRYQRVTTD